MKPNPAGTYSLLVFCRNKKVNITIFFIMDSSVNITTLTDISSYCDINKISLRILQSNKRSIAFP